MGGVDGALGGGEEARSTGNHCGRTATGWLDLTSASLLATPDLVMCGTKAAQNATATPMTTSARKLEAPFFALVALAGATSSADIPCSLFASLVASSSLFDFRPWLPYLTGRSSSTWLGAGLARVRAGAAGGRLEVRFEVK
eukprot:scaffold76598_cov49-Phaeocystis_antarctica.AAC.2